jgi:4-hydroxy-4-methyl-2-oxoglutarate aldolase
VRGSATGNQATVLRRLGQLPTPAISDALDREGILGALQDPAPLSNDFRVAGPAFTVLPVGADQGGRCATRK